RPAPRSARVPYTTLFRSSGEWRGKAGAYAVQGIAALFTTELRGSITNVVGLPLAEVVADLRAVGALVRYPPPAFGQVAPEGGTPDRKSTRLNSSHQIISY